MIRNQDHLAGALLVLFAIIGIFASVNILDPGMSSLSAGSYPLLLFICLGFMGIGLYWQGYKGVKKGFPTFKWRIILKIVGLLLFYAFSIEYIGFIISTLIFISLTMWVLEEKRIVVIAGISLSITFGIYLIFEKILKIMLP
jgi:putative tricarboxylic transport membrane protein